MQNAQENNLPGISLVRAVTTLAAQLCIVDYLLST